MHARMHTHTHTEQSQEDDIQKMAGCYSAKWMVKRLDFSLDMEVSRAYTKGSTMGHLGKHPHKSPDPLLS